MPQALQGVLIDIDGTLLDSNDANARAWMEALLAHGLEINYLKICEAVGMGGDTPYDVQAAQKAGVKILDVRCGGWAAPDLHGAEGVYNDPADLLACYGNWAAD